MLPLTDNPRSLAHDREHYRCRTQVHLSCEDRPDSQCQRWRGPSGCTGAQSQRPWSGPTALWCRRGTFPVDNPPQPPGHSPHAPPASHTPLQTSQSPAPLFSTSSTLSPECFGCAMNMFRELPAANRWHGGGRRGLPASQAALPGKVHGLKNLFQGLHASTKGLPILTGACCEDIGPVTKIRFSKVYPRPYQCTQPSRSHSDARSTGTVCGHCQGSCAHTAKSSANTLMPAGMSRCRASSESRRLPELQWQ